MRTLWSCSAVFASLVLVGACSADIEGSDGASGAGGGPAGAPGTGGSQSASGGSQPANGGSQSASGGSQSASGGSQSASGGSQSASGGSQSASGGSQSANGGSGGSGQGLGGQSPSAGGAPTAGSGGAVAGGGRGGASAIGGSAGAGRGGSAAGGASGGSGGKASGGSAGSGGGSAGSAGGSVNGGTGGGGSTTCTPWPTAKSTESLSTTKSISGVFDGQLTRYIGAGELGTGGQDEDQGALIEIEPNGTLRNVIIGSPAADGIHCKGACTLENVWWEDVGEDAATFRGASASQQMAVRCGGAKGADDKVFQHNGAGTLTIQNFTVESFGKLYRSCGNCSSQYARHLVLQDVTARTGKTLVGLNTNYGDTARLSRITLYGAMTICERYTGNSSGDEPVKTGTGPDSMHCLYQASDITQR